MSHDLIKEWSEVEGGLNIANIQDQYVKENMARLMDNQSNKNLGQELFSEAQFGTGTDSVSVSNSTATNTPAGGPGLGVLAPVSMALVRRTFPALFANKIVGVQAMSTPIGLAYAIRHEYGGTNIEVGFDKVPEYSGFTGDRNANPAAGTADAGTGVSADTAEDWQISNTAHAAAGGKKYPEIDFKIDRQPIIAKSRKLATSFSLEAAMDVKAMHGIDIEREMINMIQYELVAEQDREILKAVKDAAVDVGVQKTSDNVNLTVDAGGETIADYNVPAGDGRWSQEKFSNLVTFICDLANRIALKTRRDAGNFVVVSPRVATALQAAGPAFNRNTAMVDAATTMPEIGTINDSIKVYRDSYAAADYVLVGYKGPGVSDCGVVYSPYVTGLMNRAAAQEDFSPRIGVMSRYAITDSLLGSGRYYRFANVTGLADLLNGQPAGASITYTSAV